MASPNLRVPDSLTELDQWVLWRMETVKGRPTKVPYSFRGYRASSTDRRCWTSFDEARSVWCQNPPRYAGLGFMFSETDGMVGIDLDDCLEQEEVKPWAQGIVERFSDTYMEVSPSGKGIKVWAGGGLPTNIGGVKVGDGQIEMYDHARYFAVTGQVFREAPLQVEDHAGDVLALYAKLTGTRKTWLYQPLEGGTIPYGRQHSTLVSMCGTLRRRGLCDRAIEACLQVVNAEQCERPGPPENVSKIVKSSRGWAAK